MTLGFITVNKYLDMSEIEQTIVVAGIVDGIIAQDFFMLNSNPSISVLCPTKLLLWSKGL